ncbi:hypothetical protein CBR_g87968, partial [Chara braunii]
AMLICSESVSFQFCGCPEGQDYGYDGEQ